MAIDRRSLLIGGTAAGLWPGAIGAAHSARRVPSARFVAARRGPDGLYSAAIIDADGGDVSSVPLPGRGHDATFCPVTKRCVVFARRPGNFAVVFAADGTAPLTFTTPDDRHFYGHGVFSRDGRLLYATENDFAAGHGVVGVYDATSGFCRVGEFQCHGVGPHDLALLNAAPVLVVANGGRREHPDFGGGRRVLNPDHVVASIAFIDCRTGDPLEHHVLAAGGGVSLRHLDVGRDDTVIVGGQAQRQADAPPASIVYRCRRQSPLSVLALPAETESRLSGYVSSVAVDRSGYIAAITSSRGGIVILVELDTGRVLRTDTIADVSGVAASPELEGFMVTSGVGEMRSLALSPSIDAARPETAPKPWAWDNHLSAVEV